MDTPNHHTQPHDPEHQDAESLHDIIARMTKNFDGFVQEREQTFKEHGILPDQPPKTANHEPPANIALYPLALSHKPLGSLSQVSHENGISKGENGVAPHAPNATLISQCKATQEMQKVTTVRPELNIAKHYDLIFAPSHARNLHKPVSRSWIETLTDGTKVRASLLVEPYAGTGKRPTTKTGKVFLALQHMYEERGWNDEERTPFSINEIVQTLKHKWHGKTTVRKLREELLQLRGSLLHWKHSFVDANGDRVSIEEPITILDSMRLVTKEERTSAQLFLALGSFRFDEHIRNNLKARKTKPTNLTTALQIKGEVASVLYARLDVILADKTYYERRTKELFDDLHLEGEKEYQYPSGRKRQLERATKELEGKPISTGILHLNIERTKDGKDYKLIAEKDMLPQLAADKRVHVLERVEPANPPETIPYIAKDIAAMIGYPDRQRLYEIIATHYSTELIYRALSEYKTDRPAQHHPLKYFLAILHRHVHDRGKLWLGRQCPMTCKHLLHPTLA